MVLNNEGRASRHRASRYKLLALDLDDTLLDDSLSVSADDAQALAAAQDAGVMVVLATGRMFRSALPYARQLQTGGPIIAYQGALVKDWRREEIIVHNPVPLALALELISTIERDYGYHINVYLDDVLYVARLTPESERYTAISRVEACPVGDLLSFLQRRGQDPTKVLVIADPDQLDELQQRMRPVYGSCLHITKSKPYFLEFSHPLAHKGAALAGLAARYGYGREEVIAMGDSYNDVEMLRWAGLGVAVANARPEALAVAAYVTSAPVGQAVAEVVEKFILG